MHEVSTDNTSRACQKGVMSMRTILRILISPVLVLLPSQFVVGGIGSHDYSTPNSIEYILASNSIRSSVADSCAGDWQIIKASSPDSGIALKFVNPKGGQPFLKWKGKEGRLAELDLHRAKGPVNSNDEIEICSQGSTMVISEDSYTIKELRQDQRLEPGYYAVRVLFHLDSRRTESSDWIIIRIK